MLFPIGGTSVSLPSRAKNPAFSAAKGFLAAFVLAGILCANASAAARGWLQGKRIVQIRCQTNDVWFQVEGDSKLYGFDPTTTNGRNWYSILVAAKSSGQKIEWLYDDAQPRYGGAGWTVLGVGVM